jgi:hypothetical protein
VRFVSFGFAEPLSDDVSFGFEEPLSDEVEPSFEEVSLELVSFEPSLLDSPFELSLFESLFALSCFEPSCLDSELFEPLRLSVA